MAHFALTMSLAGGFHAALAEHARLAALATQLRRDPRAALTDLVGTDETARERIDRQPDPALRFIGAVLGGLLERAAPQIANFGGDMTPSLRTSLALSLANQTALWLEHEVDEQKLTGTVKNVFDKLYGCFVALRDLDTREDDVWDALMRLAACEAEQILDPTKNCDPERTNYEAAANSLAVAISNLPAAC